MRPGKPVYILTPFLPPPKQILECFLSNPGLPPPSFPLKAAVGFGTIVARDSSLPSSCSPILAYSAMLGRSLPLGIEDVHPFAETAMGVARGRQGNKHSSVSTVGLGRLVVTEIIALNSQLAGGNRSQGLTLFRIQSASSMALLIICWILSGLSSSNEPGNSWGFKH